MQISQQSMAYLFLFLHGGISFFNLSLISAIDWRCHVTGFQNIFRVLVDVPPKSLDFPFHQLLPSPVNINVV